MPSHISPDLVATHHSLTPVAATWDQLQLAHFSKRFGEMKVEEIQRIVLSEEPFFLADDWKGHRCPPEHPHMQRVAYENKRDLIAYAQVIQRVHGLGI